MRGIEPATKDFGVVGRESYRDFTAAPWLEIFWRNLKKSENTKYAQKSQEHKNNDKQNNNFCNSATVVNSFKFNIDKKLM